MNHPHSISVRLRIDFGPRSALGPGKIALLEAIEPERLALARGAPSSA